MPLSQDLLLSVSLGYMFFPDPLSVFNSTFTSLKHTLRTQNSLLAPLDREKRNLITSQLVQLEAGKSNVISIRKAHNAIENVFFLRRILFFLLKQTILRTHNIPNYWLHIFHVLTIGSSPH